MALDPVGTCAVRWARPEDASTLASLSRLCFSDPWDAETFERELALPEARLWLAHGGEDAAGYLVARAVAGPRAPIREVEVLSVGVHPAFRRQGIAGRLLAELRRDVGPDAELRLEVRESNAGARAFYRTLAFREVGQRPDYYPCGEAALLLTQAPELRS